MIVSCIRLLVYSLAVLIVVSSVSALVLHIDLTVFANGTVTQDNVAVLEGEPDEPSGGDAAIVEWQDEEQYRTGVALPFFALDPWRELDRQQVNVNLPYVGNRGSIILFKNQSVLWSYDLSRLCDRNKVCSGDENALGCSDCDADADGYCNLESRCDPDCRKGLDRDCEVQNADYTVVLVALAILAFGIALWRLVKKR